MPKKEARYYESVAQDLIVRCRLCPQHCVIKPGRSGLCRARINEGGKLYTHIYGEVAALALDPLEKKPLYHFYPGRQILSAGTWGCNFSCAFCQNYRLAHEQAKTQVLLPQQLAELAVKAKEQGSLGMAFTYNEPSIWLEFVLDTARLLKAQGLKTVLVSNGFIDPGPLTELLPFIDAANIDLKAFSPGFYKRNCQGRLQEVKDNIAFMAGKIHIELTHLLIAGENDDPGETEAMSAWISSLDPLIPLHLSRYFPAYKMKRPATEFAAMLQAQKICRQHLSYVYLGNLPGINNQTLCLQCGQVLIARNAYDVKITGIKDGQCIHCGAQAHYIAGC